MNRGVCWASVLCLLGLALVVFSTVWITAIEPGFEKLPTDLDETYTIEAMVQETFPSSNETQVIIERKQQAVTQENGILIVREEIIPIPEVPGILENTVLEMGVDRTSREFVPGYGDIERSNLWAYPVGVEKKTYALWSDTAGLATDAHFTGEEDIYGLRVYSFRTDEKNLTYENDPTFGFPVLLDMVIEEKVEPNTGIIVDGKSTKTFKVVLPSSMVAILPEDLRATFPEDRSPDDDIIVTALIVSQQYSEQTVLLKVADAKDLKNKLIWATQYGLWIGYGCGAILMIIGFALIVRFKLAKKRLNPSERNEIQSLSADEINEINHHKVPV